MAERKEYDKKFVGFAEAPRVSIPISFNLQNLKELKALANDKGNIYGEVVVNSDWKNSDAKNKKVKTFMSFKDMSGEGGGGTTISSDLDNDLDY